MMVGDIFLSIYCQYRILVACRILPAKALSPAAESEAKHAAYPSPSLQRHHHTPLWVQGILVSLKPLLARTSFSRFQRSPSSPLLGSWIPLQFILKHQYRGIAFCIACFTFLIYTFDLTCLILFSSKQHLIEILQVFYTVSFVLGKFY